jgi:hypothetical protein
MLKELIALNEEVMSYDMTRNVNRTASSIRKNLKSYFERKEQVVVKTIGPFEASFTIDFNYWMRPETILEVHKEFVDAIKASDINGHIHAIEDGNSTGEHYVEAMLGGIKRGMKISAEAFFPTMEYVVKWKQIIKKKK